MSRPNLIALEEGEIRSRHNSNAHDEIEQSEQVRCFPAIAMTDSSNIENQAPRRMNTISARTRKKDLKYLISLIDLPVTYRNRNDIALRCFEIFNYHVFDNQIPENMQIYWNMKICASLSVWSEIDNAISLSLKLLLTGDLLCDFLLHAMIHCAVSLIDKVPLNRTHSNYFQVWSNRAKTAFPELSLLHRTTPTEHTYQWHYNCQVCGKTYKRHRNTIDVVKKRCACGGVLNRYRNAGQLFCRHFVGRDSSEKSKVYCRFAA